MKRILWGFFFLFCIILNLGAQNLQATGKGIGPDRDTARREAIRQGLEKAFIQKDAFFLNLFLSDLILYSTLETINETASQSITGSHTVELTVRVDATAVEAINNKYTEAVSSILAEAEREITAAQNLLDAGSNALKKENFSQAWNYYSEARSRTQSILGQISTFKDEMVRSDQGNPKSVVQKLAELRDVQAQQALDRLREVEKATLVGKNQTDLFDSYTAFEGTHQGITLWVKDNLEQSPYYDVPPEILNKKKLELGNQREKIRGLENEYSKLSALSDSTSLLFQARIRQAQTDLINLGKDLDKITLDLDAELRDPRIDRVERDRQSRKYWQGVNKALGEAAQIALLKESQEIIAFRLFFPYQVRNEKGQLAGLLPLSFKGEGRYSNIWLMTRFDWISREFLIPTDKISAMTQTLGFGFGDPWIFGVGFQWDWRRVTTMDTQPGHRWKGHFYWGLADENLEWPLWMLDAWAEVAEGKETPDFGSYFNLGIDATLRFTRWVKLEAGLLTRTLGSGTALGNTGLYRETGFWASGGFKLPNPFLWGVRFENMTVTRLLDNSYRLYNTWQFFLEYSL